MAYFLAIVFETNVQSCSLLVKEWFVDYQVVVKDSLKARYRRLGQFLPLMT